MNIALVKPLTQLGAKLLFAAKRHAPELLVGSGIIAFGVSVYEAIKGTVKATEILEERDANIEAVEKCAEESDIVYTSDDEEKDRKNIKIKTTWKLVKAYAPAVLTFIIAIALVLAGFKIIHARNVGLAAAFKTLEQKYENREKYLPQEQPTTAELLAEGKTDAEIKEAKAEARRVFVDNHRYCIIYDDRFDSWTTDAAFNAFKIKCAEKYVTEKLQEGREVLLLDATRILGIPDKIAIEELNANVVGWWPSHDGSTDNKGDFGLNEPQNLDFIYAHDPVAILNFNVDGIVYKYTHGRSTKVKEG